MELKESKEVAGVEQEHEKGYLAALKNLNEGKVLKKDKSGSKWRCPDCPYIQEGDEASDECPGLCV